MLTRLDPIVLPADEHREGAGRDHPMRTVTVETAAGYGWNAERAATVAQLFDGLASGWSARVGSEAEAPLSDAFDRGHVPLGGRCLEVGSGTGNVTPVLARVFEAAMCVDLSWEMLAHAPTRPGWRVRADASRLPVPPGSFDVAALVNAFLFPTEIERVLRADGRLIWVNTLGDRTPIYLPPEQVLESLPGSWDGIASQAGWAHWLVARRVR